MAIREELVLDSSKYRKELDNANRATIKYARKQERLHKQNKQSLRAIQTELKRLRAVREASNNPKAVRKYTDTIEKLEKEQRQLRKETERYGRAAKESSEKTQSSFKKIGKSAKRWLAGIAAGAMIALTAALRKGVQLAQSIEETGSKYETVLGPAIDDANKFLEENATLMGLSNTQAKDMLATTTAIAQGFGYSGDQAAELGMRVVKLAGDMQSFHDVPIERTHNAITSALSGETEALKSLGIVIRQEMVTQRAMNDTGKESVSALTQQERATATLALITEKAGVAIGDLARTQNSAANRSRQVWAEIRNIGEILSTTLLPAIDSTLTTIAPLVDRFKEWVEVPLSEELEQERLKLNSLVLQITSANTGQQRRNDLITTLQKEYPDFLKNLDAEKVSNEQLADRLEEVNKKYADRIVVQKQAEKVAEALEKRDRATIDLADERIKVNEHLLGLVERFGLQVDMTNKSTQERINLVKEALRTEAKFGEGRDYIIKANDQAKAIISLEKATSGFTNAQKSLKESEENLIDVEKRRKEVFEALGLTMNDVNEQMDEYNRNAGSAGQSGNDPSNSLSNLGINIPTVKLEEMAGLISQIEQDFSKLGDVKGSIVGLEMERATRNVQNYNAALREAHNELKAGAITQEQYERKVEQATDKFLGEVKKIYRSFKDQLTPAQETFFEELLGNIEDAADESENMTDKLDDLADMADSLINVADALGAIGDKARQSLTGVADLLRNASKLSNLGPDAGFLDKAIPGIGIASGLITTFAGLLPGGGDQGMSQEELKKLNESIFENKLALERNTRAIEKNTIVASEARQSQVSDLEKLFDKLLSGLTTDAGGGWQTTSPLGPGEVIKILQQIESIGKEAGLGPAFQGLVDQFKDLLKAEGGDVANALQKLLKANRTIFGDIAIGEGGLADALQKIINQFRQYGDSIDGALQQFRDSIKLGGLSTEEAFNNLITKLREVGVPDEVLQSLQAIDITTEEGKKRLNDLIKQLFNREDIGELNQSEWQDLLEFLKGLTEGDIGGATGEEAGGYSRSTQIANSITEIQANEMLFFLERIEAWTRSLAANFGDQTAIQVTQNGGSIPSFNIPIPLPVRVVNDNTGVDRANMSNKEGGPVKNTTPINIGDVNLSKGITESDIDEVTRAINQKLKQEMRGGRF